MKPVVRQQECPDSWGERPCTQYPVETFFPRRMDREGIAAAQAVCRACPLLARCARWAAAPETEISECVVATVRMPDVHASAAEVRRARARLLRVAAEAAARDAATVGEAA